MGGARWWALLLLAASAALPGAAAHGQPGRADGYGLPDSWRAAVYSFEFAPRGDAPRELLQLLPQTSPSDGRFLHIRVDRARDRYERHEGRYRIQGTEILLYRDGPTGGAPDRARYYGTLICMDGPPGTAPLAFRFVRPQDRRTPPPPWPDRQRRPPSSC
ncbi:MAG TPA: hypothetical protein VIL18_02940 [Longimicrobiales bacterium]